MSDLDDLLDDALKDFDFGETTPNPNVSSHASTQQSVTPATAPSSNPSVPNLEEPHGQQEAWADEFMEKALENDPELKQLMEEMKEVLGKAGDPSNGQHSSVPLPNLPDLDMDNPEWAKNLESLKSMIADAENGEENPELLDKILEASGMGDMMKQLMSKEVLLDPFKEMDGLYTQWLSRSHENISTDEMNRYRSQHDLVKAIIKAYETEDNSADIVAGLISQMQDLGDPPAHLLEKLVPGMKFDPSGNPLLNAPSK